MSDPFAPDAPLIQLLSLKSNPLLATATPEQLLEVVRRLRTVVQQPVTLKAELNKESTGRKPSAKKAFLEGL